MCAALPQQMNTLPECPITDTASLLPHSGRMVLIDRINRYGDDFVEAVTQIRSDHILLVDGMLPYTAFIELMAQAVGAYAGIQARKNARANLKFLPNPSLSEHICWQRRICLFKTSGVWVCSTANCVGRTHRKLRPKHSPQTAFWHAPH